LLTTSTHRAPEDILGALEFAPNPMYLLSVGHRQEIRFVGANSAYARATGVTSGAIANKRPDEILPSRIADAALANFRECCTRGSNYTFQENLGFPAGRCWWLTTLAPISDAERIHTIVGSSVDISAMKDNAAIKSLEYHCLSRRVDDLRLVAANAAEDARGPLNNILSLSRMLKCERVSTEEAGSIAALMEDTAARSLKKLEHQTRDAVTSTVAYGDRTDFGQLCREFATLVDPQAKMKIRYPDRVFDVDEATARLFLNSIADQAAMRDATFLNINITPSPIDSKTLRLVFEFDTLPGSRVNLVQLGTLCQIHGIKIRHVIHDATHRVEFLLPFAGRRVKTIAVQGTERIRVSA